METIGQRIRRLRTERGFKRQVEFAPMVYMTQSSLSDVESKNKEFTARQLLALSRVLRVSPEHIMEGGEDEDMESLELMRIFKQLEQAERQMLLRVALSLLPVKGKSEAA